LNDLHIRKSLENEIVEEMIYEEYTQLFL